MSSKYPIFTVNGMDAGRLLRILIYAVNIKGRSETVILEGFMLKAAEKQTGSQNNFELMPILSIGIFIGILTALLCIAIATVAALKLRTKQQQKYQHQQQKGKGMTFSRPGNLPIKDKIFMPISHSEEMYDEKNSDVVLYNEVDAEYKLKSATQTPSGLNWSRTSEPELVGKPIDARSTFLNKQNDELHYAELALAIPITKNPVDCNTITPNSCSNTLTTKPPAYDYFDEPTIYTQIDHYKSTSSNVASSMFPPLILPALHISSTTNLYPGSGSTAVTLNPVGPGGATSLKQSLIASSSATVAATATTAKPFSREIVTVRTPLMYTQQEYQ